jgi:hypothetical protein
MKYDLYSHSNREAFFLTSYLQVMFTVWDHFGLASCIYYSCNMVSSFKLVHVLRMYLYVLNNTFLLHSNFLVLSVVFLFLARFVHIGGCKVADLCF